MEDTKQSMIKQSTPVYCTFLLWCLEGLEGEDPAAGPAKLEGGSSHMSSLTLAFEGLNEHKDPAVGIADQSEASCVQEL